MKTIRDFQTLIAQSFVRNIFDKASRSLKINETFQSSVYAFYSTIYMKKLELLADLFLSKKMIERIGKVFFHHFFLSFSDVTRLHRGFPYHD